MVILLAAAVLFLTCLLQARPGLPGPHDDRVTRRQNRYDRLFARAAEHDPQQDFRLLACAAVAVLLALYDLVAFAG